MLEEAQRLECIVDGKDVKDWTTLRELFSKGEGDDVTAMYEIAIGVFEISPGWMGDTEKEILEKMGWVYDPLTFKKGKNNIGNAVVEKVISRAKTDLRGRLRKCCLTGRSGFTLPIRRPKEKTLRNGKYFRRVPGIPDFAVPKKPIDSILESAAVELPVATASVTRRVAPVVAAADTKVYNALSFLSVFIYRILTKHLFCFQKKKRPMTQGNLESEVERLNRVICMLTNVDEDTTEMAEEDNEFLDGVKKEMRLRLQKKMKERTAAIAAKELSAKNKPGDNGDSDYDLEEDDDDDLPLLPATARKNRLADGEDDDDDLPVLPATAIKNRQAASMGKKPAPGKGRKSYRKIGSGKRKRCRDDDDESTNNHTNVDDSRRVLAKLPINIVLMPTQDVVEKDASDIEDQTDDDTVVEMVDCGDEIHEKNFDDFQSTPHSVYFKEGGKFFGRKCGRCNLEFTDKKEAGKIKTNHAHHAYYCPRKNCPFMLCSKCLGLVLVAGGLTKKGVGCSEELEA